MSALDNLGSHLLGRKPSEPDARNFPLELFLSTDPVDVALAALLKDKGVATATKTWARFEATYLKAVKLPAPTPAPTPAPSGSVLWHDAEPTLDQGQTPHCIGDGGAQWVNTDPVNDHYTQADADKLYYECKVLDGEPGVEDGSSVHTLVKALGKRGLVTTYAFASSTDTITAWLKTKGPVVAGTDWYNDMFNPDGNGVVVPTGGIAGGHCYLLDEFVPAGATAVGGFVPTEDFYGFHNSWSEGWGIKGRAYISVANFAKLLAAQGEALAAVEVA